MVSLDKETIFEATAQILLEVDHCVTVHYRPEGTSIQFPTTRRLAEYLGVPHYYVLPYFAEMERAGLIRRVERVGISTTPKGTKLLVTRMASHHQAAAVAVIGARTFSELLLTTTSEEVNR